MPKKTPHGTIQAKMREAASLAGHRLFPWPVGMYERGDRIVRYGTKGQPDLVGWTREGIFCMIEIKQAGEKLRKEQRQFHEAARISNDRIVIATCYGMDDIPRVMESLSKECEDE